MADCRSIDSNRLPGCWPNLHPKAWKRKETQLFASPVFCRSRLCASYRNYLECLAQRKFEGPGSAVVRLEFRQWPSLVCFKISGETIWPNTMPLQGLAGIGKRLTARILKPRLRRNPSAQTRRNPEKMAAKGVCWQAGTASFVTCRQRRQPA